jgi:hypothetical protein
VSGPTRLDSWPGRFVLGFKPYEPSVAYGALHPLEINPTNFIGSDSVSTLGAKSVEGRRHFVPVNFMFSGHILSNLPQGEFIQKRVAQR